MSEELIVQWTRRVSDAEEELRRMEDDINAAKQQRKTLKSDIRKYEDVVATEKGELLHALEKVEAQAKALGAQCEATLSEKDRVEAEYMATLDAYENLHFLVREIKDAEERLQSRDDLEAQLQRESVAWAEEEHAMRRKLHQLQQQQAQTRRAQEAELRELEAQLANMEQRQREERAARSGDAVRRVAQVGGSRPGTPTPATAFPDPTTTAAAAASAEEDAFVHANAGVAVPTRAAPLKSCLKAPAPCSSGGAPVPAARCVSQPLVSDSAAAAAVRRGAAVSGALDGPALRVLQEMRAFSYGGPTKPAARKRAFLGDATNEKE